ncbi:hypothetical protein [Pseudorhodoferax sp. Leaf267]|uniref:hypothetical protein n=1 Tax=Pseudorhodoferax sp. Leaf267 TaxID=1736316 RepID=UPI0006F20F1B|nr:hypothetical protein [Pseudorhodoferax sp. Leaf267]KQP17184.1 hypothetical protein ASF43_29420 [Pseudorhodoferax sp. Leaf267]
MPIKSIVHHVLDRKKAGLCFLVVALPALFFYAISLATMVAHGFSVMDSLRDPAQTRDESSFLGFLSNIGTWLWVSATAISVFTWLTGDFQATSRRRELVVLVGLLSIMLAVDDFFMIHDRYISQRICYLAYALCAGAILVRHYRLIAEIDGLAFLLAGAMLASSILVDLSQPWMPSAYLQLQILEEGLKFMGAAMWMYFVGRVASFRP